ncbi:hypothetical protein [Candidatus Binatus sp.]|uniref:hypothetical protein n=1 Tax=Candidatus Binatus sp. TaxID=2811406 RepID=UPI003C671720
MVNTRANNGSNREAELQEQIGLECREIVALTSEVAKLENRFDTLYEQILTYIKNTGDANCMGWLENEEEEHNPIMASTNKWQENFEHTGSLAPGDFNARLLRLEHRLKVAKTLRAQLELHKSYLESTIARMQIKLTGRSS